RVFLADALEYALRPCSLDPHGNTGILFLKHLREVLGEHQLDRGVEHDLPLRGRGFDKFVCDRRRRGERRTGDRLRRYERREHPKTEPCGAFLHWILLLT